MSAYQLPFPLIKNGLRGVLFLVLSSWLVGADDERIIWTDIGNLEITVPKELPLSVTGRFQQAVRLIGIQPRTAANLAAARAILEELASDASPPEVAAGAGYYQARILQWELPQPKPLEAAERYLALHAKYPATFHGELALLRAVPIIAYLTPDRSEVVARLESLTALSRTFSHAMIRRNAYSALSEAYHRLALSAAKAAELAAAAAAIPFDHRGLYASALLAAATRANAAGNRPEASAMLVRFLADFPDDVRAFEARHLLNGWGGVTP